MGREDQLAPPAAPLRIGFRLLLIVAFSGLILVALCGAFLLGLAFVGLLAGAVAGVGGVPRVDASVGLLVIVCLPFYVVPPGRMERRQGQVNGSRSTCALD